MSINKQIFWSSFLLIKFFKFLSYNIFCIYIYDILYVIPDPPPLAMEIDNKETIEVDGASDDSPAGIINKE